MYIDTEIGGRCTSTERDRVLAGLAARQHGTVARRQLLALGFGRRWIDHQVQRGRLLPLHAGVYAVGHVCQTVRGRYMAATLAAGPDAVLSHRSAAVLHQVRDFGAGRIEVTTPKVRRRPGLLVHVSPVALDERDRIDQIPVTSLHRTILDLAAVVTERHVERAMDQATRGQLTDVLSYDTLIGRHPCHRGAPTVKRILARNTLGRTMTRSDLEEAFLAYASEHRLPRPECNVDIPDADGIPMEVDAAYRVARIAIELDSRAWHDNAVSFVADRDKSRRLSVAGWHPIRVAAEHLRTANLARDLRALLARTP